MPHRPAKMYSGDSAVPTITQRAPLAVDQRGQRVAGLEPVRLREALGDQRLERCRRPRPSSASSARPLRDGHAVHALRRARVDADQLADDRVGLCRRSRRAPPPRSWSARRPRRAISRSASASALRRALDARRTRRRSARRRRSGRAPAPSDSTADSVVMKPPMPLATTSAIVSAWLHMQPQVAQQLAVERLHRLTSDSSAGVEPVRVALDALRCGRRRGGPRGRPCRRWRRCA